MGVPFGHLDGSDVSVPSLAVSIFSHTDNNRSSTLSTLTSAAWMATTCSTTSTSIRSSQTETETVHLASMPAWPLATRDSRLAAKCRTSPPPRILSTPIRLSLAMPTNLSPMAQTTSLELLSSTLTTTILPVMPQSKSAAKCETHFSRASSIQSPSCQRATVQNAPAVWHILLTKLSPNFIT